MKLNGKRRKRKGGIENEIQDIVNKADWRFLPVNTGKILRRNGNWLEERSGLLGND
jgi:hypothetical protein